MVGVFWYCEERAKLLIWSLWSTERKCWHRTDNENERCYVAEPAVAVIKPAGSGRHWLCSSSVISRVEIHCYTTLSHYLPELALISWKQSLRVIDCQQQLLADDGINMAIDPCFS